MLRREKECPCRKCEERVAGCHKDCTRWLEWEKEHAERRDELRRLRKLHIDLDHTCASTAVKERPHKREWHEEWEEKKK